MTHPDTLERYVPRYYQDGQKRAFCNDIYNTAEECVAFAYEQARIDGQCAGFIAELDDIGRLPTEDVHTLVLPPLTGLTDTDLEMIRKVHMAGVGLVAFESVAGLEDLFGVTAGKQATIKGIRVNSGVAGNALWSEIGDEREIIRHSMCRAAYQCQGAATILEGLDARGRSAAPVLTTHRTRWGNTALFTIPPTVVHRESGGVGGGTISYGKASLSRLINRAMALILRQIGKPDVETTEGKLIGFRDTKGRAHIIVEEDNHPEEERYIEPEITIRLPGINPERIQCDKPFEIISIKPSYARLRIPLEPDDCAMITINPD